MASGASLAPEASAGGLPSPGAPLVVGIGQVFVLTEYRATVEVVVTDLQATTITAGTHVRITVSYRSNGPGDFSTDPRAWSLIAIDGTQAAFTAPASGGLVASSISAGASAGGTLEATVAAAADNLFVAYTDASGMIRFMVPASTTGGAASPSPS